MNTSIDKLITKLFGLIAPIFEGRQKDRNFLLQMIPKNSVCAEIGVWKGEFSEQIIKVVKPQNLHLIDPWKYIASYSNRWYGGTIAQNQKDMDKIHEKVGSKFKKEKCVVIHRCGSEKAVRKFKDEYFDFVYIDGDHSYEFVKKDLEDYLPKVKKNGYIIADDYSFWKVLLGYEVKRAVDGFIRDNEKLKLQVIKDQAIIKVV